MLDRVENGLDRIPQIVWKYIAYTLLGGMLLFLVTLLQVHPESKAVLYEVRWGLLALFALMVRWQTGVGWWMWIVRGGLLLEGIERAVIEGVKIMAIYIASSWREHTRDASREVGRV